MPMTSNEFQTKHSQRKYYQEKWYINKELKAFQNIVAIF